MRGHYIGALIDVLEELGVNRRHFLAGCGVSESDLTSDTLIDLPRIKVITARAVELCPNQPLGLEVGRRLNINTHGPLGYAAMASATYADALGLLLKYYKVQAPKVKFAVAEVGQRFEIQIEPSYILPTQPWLTTEFLVTSIYASTDFLFCGHLSGAEIRLNYPPPPHAAAYHQVFKIPVLFDQPFSGLIVASEMARQPLSSADPAVAQLFVKRCETLQQLAENEDLPHRIKHILFMSCPDVPSLTELAERIHVSPSTLHRKLGENGCSYKDLVAEVKQQLARQHLEADELTIDEIAHLLGFSDASNFRRAFISWTGKTPSEYRKGPRDPGVED